MKLDDLDKKILFELEQDSRQSNSSISRKVGANKNLVNYRIERLEKKGVIKGYSWISNQVLLGKISFGVLISFKNINLDDEKNLITKIKKLKSVSWTCSINGKWDLIIVIIEKDIISFNSVLENIFSICDGKIKKYNFYSEYMGCVKGHDYLYTKSNMNNFTYGGTKSIELNKTESRVFELLKKDAKIPLLQIANKLNKTYDTVKMKYSSLKSKRVLLRCSPRIDVSVLDYEQHLLFLNLSPTSEGIKKFEKFCIKHPNIIRYSKCLGHFNFILNIDAKNLDSVKEINYIIRNGFEKLINSWEIIRIN